jgi:hypothetical protein
VLRALLGALVIGIGVGGGGTAPSSPPASTRTGASHSRGQGGATSPSTPASGVAHGSQASGEGPSTPGTSVAGGTHVVPIGPNGGGFGPAPAGAPVAYFTVTSPVAPGAAVLYTDESYDLTPGATIVSRSWLGRRATFAAPGVYPVSLSVVDNYGRRATYSTNVLVSATVANAPAGKPHAFFLVTSPVGVGDTVQYTDESYDLDPTAQIVNEQWTGRQTTFTAAGTYPVSLRVEDSTGVWSSAFTRDVVVAPQTGDAPSGAPTSSPPPQSVVWSATVAPNPAARGARLTVTAVASAPPVGPPTLVAPASWTGTWGGVPYASANASAAMTAASADTFVRTLQVPASADFPAGSYILTIDPPAPAPPLSLAVVVIGATTYEEPLVAGM